MRRRLTLACALLVRGVVLFLAAFTVLGLVGAVRGRATDLALWFVDVRDLPPLIQDVALGTFAATLGAWALARTPGRRRRLPAAAASAAFAILAARDTARFFDAVAGGQVRPAVPVPLSLFLAVGLALIAVWIVRDHGIEVARPWATRVAVVAVAVVAVASFPVIQIAFFGTTDYRRPADAAVILGARVYASGDPSPLLADRIATGVSLYREGAVPILVMSGGLGSDGFNEATVMRDRAIGLGVPATAILVDDAGVTTEATVDHALALLGGVEGRSAPLRLIAVSQAYHLPRIQLAFSAAGIDVLTVPAVDPVPISEMPILVAREIPAFWLYYLRACLG